jgi:predicted dehydrogenase
MRLGLLSTARINDSLLGGASISSEVDVAAVASRDLARARAYADARGIPLAFGSYEELLASDDVDAVYVSLPNGLHAEWAIRAVEAGKHVLVEKPLSPRVAEVERVFDAAEAAGRVVTEGFMWRHHPQTKLLSSLVADGVVGEVRLVRASFSFTLAGDDPRWSPSLDGGSLMDVGCYGVSAARLLCGEPSDVAGFAVDRGGVDTRFAAVLRFGADGPLATIDCGFDLPMRKGLEVVGADGVLTVADAWSAEERGIALRRAGSDEVETFDVPEANMYALELDDLAAAVRERRSPLLGRDDAVGQARVLEALLS